MEKSIEQLPTYHAKLGCPLTAQGIYCAECEMEFDPDLDPEDLRSPNYHNLLERE